MKKTRMWLGVVRFDVLLGAEVGTVEAIGA